MVATDTDTARIGRALLASLLAAVVVTTTVAAAGVGGAAARSTAASPHDNGVGANYTVVLPNEADHYPGEQGGKASIQHLSTGEAVFENNGAEGLEVLKFIVISSPSIDFSSCTTENTRAFGVDRGNDDGGTQTDESLLKHREDSSFQQNKIVVEFFGDDSIAGESTHLNKSDQIVAVQADCYVMPEEPGWYQINARLNGTSYSGEHVDESGITSHYFYVCDCASEQEAREKLGPPPSEEGSGDGSGDGDGGDDSSSTPTATPTASDGGDDGSTPTATEADGGSEDETTPTATAAESGGGDAGDSTTTAAGGGGESDGTPTTATDGSPAGEGTTATPGNSESGNGGGGAASSGTPADGATPTIADGAGFGLLAALVGLLAAAMLAARRP